MAVTNGVHVNGNVKNETTPDNDATISSPYTSQAINVRIGPNGANYTILQAMVEQHPGLQARMNQKKPGSPIELPEVDEDIAHTLIHFIYTQKYQSLGLGGIPETARAAAEFKRSVLAYFAARLCSIEQLEEVTRSKMEHFSKQISVFDIQEIVAQISARLPQNEVWFPEHLYRWVKSMLQENDGLVANERLVDLIGKSPLFDKAVVRSVTEMYSEKAAALKLFSPKEGGQEEDVGAPVVNGGRETAFEAQETLPTESKVPTSEATAIDDDAPQAIDQDSSDIKPAEAAEASSELTYPVFAADIECVKAVDTSTIKVESIPETDPEPETVEAGSAVNGKEDELARVDSASKATDSDVEAARAKTNSKKSKKKNKKKGGVEA